MRLSRDQMLMAMAGITAMRSTCLRLQVGAVAARDGRLLGSGYNGSASGLPHCDVLTCNVHNPCTNTVHAEQGLISFAARHGVRLEGSTLYVTHAPCQACAGLILNTGMARVVYAHPYRITTGLEMLESGGIKVSHFQNPIGLTW